MIGPVKSAVSISGTLRDRPKPRHDVDGRDNDQHVSQNLRVSAKGLRDLLPEVRISGHVSNRVDPLQEPEGAAPHRARILVANGCWLGHGSAPVLTGGTIAGLRSQRQRTREAREWWI